MLMFVGIARIYGPETFGQFTTAHIYLTLFLYLADFGFDQLVATEIARDASSARSQMERFFPLKLVAGSVATVAMWAIALVSGVSSSTIQLMFVLSSGLLVTTLATYYFAVARGHEELHHEAVVVSLQQGFLLVVLLGVAVLRLSIMWVAVAFVLSRILGLALIRRRIRDRLSLRLSEVTLRNWSSTLLQGLPWGIHLLFGALYFQLDTLLLSAWRGDHAAGIYQSAMKLAVVVLVVPDVLVSALLPTFARLHNENKQKWEELGRIASRTLFYVSLPFALIFVLYPHQVLALVYGGEGFADAVPVLRMLGAILVVRFSVETFGLVLTTTRNQTIRMWLVVGVTILNISLNSYAIPRYGVEGAISVSLVSNIVVGIGYAMAARRVGFSLRLLVGKRSVLVLILSSLMGAALWSFANASLIAGFVTVMVVCPLICYLVGYSADERKMVFELRTRLV